MASKTQNKSTSTITFLAVTLDTSTDNIWIQARTETPSGQEGTLQFFGVIEGACYFPIILEPVDYAGKAMLDNWMNSGGPRRLTSIQAYGLANEYERGPKFCLPPPP